MVNFNKKRPYKETAGTDKPGPARQSKLPIKGGQAPQVKLEVAGDSAIGFYHGYKIADLPDTNHPGGTKAVRFYEFREEEDELKKFVVSGRLMLDEAFDAVVAKLGGVENLVGELVQFTRLADTRLTGKKRMGNYEIEVFESK